MLLTSPHEVNAVYTLTGPDGQRAVFNSPSDPDYVGMLTDVSGLDSPDVRENADDLVQMDGGIHGDFFHGRRPITLSIRVFGMQTIAERNMRLTKLERATNAMRQDATLTWTPTGGVESYVSLRRQQPMRAAGAWVKDIQVGLVAADPRIYSTATHSQSVGASAASGASGFTFPITFPLSFGAAVVTGQIFAENQGSTETFPVYTITGPGTNPAIYNATTGKRMSFAYTLNAGETLVVDTLNHTVMLNGSVSRYSAYDFINSEWAGLVPGTNDVRLEYYSYGAGASLGVDWRDAWL